MELLFSQINEFLAVKIEGNLQFDILLNNESYCASWELHSDFLAIAGTNFSEFLAILKIINYSHDLQLQSTQ